MNQLQKNVIRIKKPELLELTECADIFLAHFEPYNIFCTEEVEKIKACKYKTQKAAVFYDIIVTKTGSYGTLLKALKETNQSGVLNVLNSTNISVFDNLDLQYSKKLGTQEQCRTFTGVFGHRNVCVKKEDVEDNDGLKCKTDTLYQLKLLSSIENHSNLLMYYTTKFSSSNSPHLQIVFELCDTNLSDWIKVPKPEADLPVLVLNVLRQLTVGVKYLHDHNIVHSNLRPSHILLKQNSVLKRETVKIANFKLARELESSCKTYEASCEKILKHSDYYPQEILQHGGKGSVNIGKEIDIFSVGCIFQFVASHGEHPFGIKFLRTANILQNKIIPSDNVFQNTENWDFDSVVEKMIDFVPKKRPSISIVLKSIPTE